MVLVGFARISIGCARKLIGFVRICREIDKILCVACGPQNLSMRRGVEIINKRCRGHTRCCSVALMHARTLQITKLNDKLG